MSSEDPWFKPKREPDEVIGGELRPYMLRWHIARKSRIPFLSKLLENVYLHRVVRSDDDRALHDHPWWNVSIVLWGGYYEYVPIIPETYARDSRMFPEHMLVERIWRGVGSIVFRRATQPHRLEIPAHPVHQTWTIFITGRKSREWGFYCQRGWRHWTVFNQYGCRPVVADKAESHNGWAA